MCNFNVI